MKYLFQLLILNYLIVTLYKGYFGVVILLSYVTQTLHKRANLISKNPIAYGLISNCIWDLVCKEKLKTNLELSKITMNSLVELSYE